MRTLWWLPGFELRLEMFRLTDVKGLTASDTQVLYILLVVVLHFLFLAKQTKQYCCYQTKTSIRQKD